MDHHQQNSGMFRKTTSQSEQRKTILGSGFGGDIGRVVAVTGRACSGVCGWGSQLRLWADAQIKNRNCRKLPASGCSTKSLVNGRPEFFHSVSQIGISPVRCQIFMSQPGQHRSTTWDSALPGTPMFSCRPAAACSQDHLLEPLIDPGEGPHSNGAGGMPTTPGAVRQPPWLWGLVRHRNSASSTAYQTNILHVYIYIMYG